MNGRLRIVAVRHSDLARPVWACSRMVRRWLVPLTRRWVGRTLAAMRGLMGLGASTLAGVAAIVSSQDGDADLVPFFVGLTFLGGGFAWAEASGDPVRRRSQ